jgi:hypothetical protein
MSHKNSVARAPLDREITPFLDPIGPRHLLGLVLGTCFWSTVLQWCWEGLIVTDLPLAPPGDVLPIDVPITLLALFMVKSAMSIWHPVFKLDVPAMWRALVLGSVQP